MDRSPSNGVIKTIEHKSSLKSFIPNTVGCVIFTTPTWPRSLYCRGASNKSIHKLFVPLFVGPRNLSSELRSGVSCLRDILFTPWGRNKSCSLMPSKCFSLTIYIRNERKKFKLITDRLDRQISIERMFFFFSVRFCNISWNERVTVLDYAGSY